METEGDRVISRRVDGKFDLFNVNKEGKRVPIGEALFPLPYLQARKDLDDHVLWLWEPATRRIDLTDARLASLRSYAETVVLLLDRTPPVSDLVGELDDLLGAVYELIAAVELGFKGKIGRSDHQAAVARARQLAKGDVRLDGNWMAGFHFNSAMFRISALFDRLPKTLAKDHAAAAAEYKIKTGKEWENKDANAIRVQVNTLKHDAGGAFGGRRSEADLGTAMAAVAQLLDLATTLT